MKRINRKNNSVLYISELIALLQSELEDSGDIPVCVEEAYKGDDKGWGLLKDISLCTSTLYGYESIVCLHCSTNIHEEKIPEKIQNMLNNGLLT